VYPKQVKTWLSQNSTAGAADSLHLIPHLGKNIQRLSISREKIARPYLVAQIGNWKHYICFNSLVLLYLETR